MGFSISFFSHRTISPGSSLRIRFTVREIIKVENRNPSLVPPVMSRKMLYDERTEVKKSHDT